MFSCLLGHLCSMVISKQASWINETISLTSIHLTSLLSILSNAVNKNFFFFFLMKLHALDLIRWFKTIAYKKKKSVYHRHSSLWPPEKKTAKNSENSENPKWNFLKLFSSRVIFPLLIEKRKRGDRREERKEGRSFTSKFHIIDFESGS